MGTVTYLRVGIDGTAAQDGSRVVTRSLDDISQSAKKTTEETGKVDTASQNLAKTFDGLKSAIGGAVAAFATWKLTQYAEDATKFAANVQLSTRALQAIGNATGHTAAEMMKYRDAVRDTNITTSSATNAVAQLSRAHLDLDKAVPLAKMAQGAAIMASMKGETISSSEALDRMIHAIITGNTVQLHQLGIMVSQRDMLRENREATGEASTAVDAHQRHVLLYNETLQQASNLTDLYAQSVDLAAKKISSSQRPLEELKLALGELFLPEYSAWATVFYETVAGGMKYVKSHTAELHAAKEMVKGLSEGLLVGVGVVGSFSIAMGLAATVTGGAAAGAGIFAGALKLATTQLSLTGAEATITTAKIGAMGETIKVTSTVATVGLTSVKVAFAALGAFMVGWEIGKTLSEQFESVRKAGVYAVYALIAVWKELQFTVREVWAVLSSPVNFTAAVNNIEAEREKWRKSHADMMKEQLADQSKPTAALADPKFKDNQAAIAKGRADAAALLAEEERRRREKAAEEAAKIAEREAAYRKKLDDESQKEFESRLALEVQTAKNSMTQRLALLQQESDLGLITTQKYLSDKGALEKDELKNQLDRAKEAIQKQQGNSVLLKEANSKAHSAEWFAEQDKLNKLLGEQSKIMGELDQKAVSLSTSLKKAVLDQEQALVNAVARLQQMQGDNLGAGSMTANLNISRLQTQKDSLKGQLNSGPQRPEDSLALRQQMYTIDKQIAAERLTIETLAFKDKEAQASITVDLLKQVGLLSQAEQILQNVRASDPSKAKEAPATKALRDQQNQLKMIEAEYQEKHKTESANLAIADEKKDPFTQQLNQMKLAYDQQMELLDARKEAFAGNSDAIVKIIEQEQLLTAQYGMNTRKVKRDELTSQVKMYSDYAGTTTAIMSSLASQQDTSSRKGFETAKMYNLSAAVVSTAAGIANGLTMQPFYPVGVAAAATAAAIGAVQIAKISSTSFGSGGGVSAPASQGSFGGGAGSASASVGSAIGAPIKYGIDATTTDAMKSLADSAKSASLAVGDMTESFKAITNTFAAGGQGSTLVDRAVALANGSILSPSGNRVAANDPATITTLQSMIQGGESTIEKAAIALGTSMGPVIQTYIPKWISTEGSFKENMQATLNAALTGVLNDYAKAVKGLEQYAKPGEDATAALERLVTALYSVNDQLDKFGMNLLSGLSGANIASKLEDAFKAKGSDLQTAMNDYFKGMFTENQQTAMTVAQETRQVNTAFEQMGLTMPQTKADFIALVNSLDLTTASGQSTFATLMSISKAFGDLQDKSADLKEAIKSFADDLSERNAAADGLSYTAKILKLVADQEKELADTRKNSMDVNALLVTQAKEYAAAVADIYKKAATDTISIQSNMLKTLTGLLQNHLTPLQQYEADRATYQQTKAAAIAGDKQAQSNLATMAQNLLKSSEGYNASNAQYQMDYQDVVATLSKLGGLGTTSPTLQVAQNQLNALTYIQQALNDGNKQSVQYWSAMLTNTGITASYIRGWLANQPGSGNQTAADAIVSLGLPSYDSGSAGLLRDQVAQVHKGEIILDQTTSGFLQKYGIQVGIADNYNSPRSLNMDGITATNRAFELMIRHLEAISRNTEAGANHAAAGVRVMQAGLSGLIEVTGKQAADTAEIKRKTRQQAAA